MISINIIIIIHFIILTNLTWQASSPPLKFSQLLKARHVLSIELNTLPVGGNHDIINYNNITT